MKIAITGASGFIGSELLLLYKEHYSEHEIVSFSRSEDGMRDGIEWRQTDYSVCSLKTVLADVDSIIHLAAVRGTTGVKTDYNVNEEMTENILLAMAETSCKNIILASTIAVYSDVDSIPWKESDALSPKTLYGISKAACEHLVIYYSKKFGYSYSIVRIAQVLGMGETRRGMMNVFIDSAAAGGEITVIGESKARRQYIYVHDLCEILMDSAVSTESHRLVINAGMPCAYTNLEIARICNKVYENKTPVKYDDSKPETIEPSYMDISVLIDVLGYKPLDMEEALLEMKKH